MAKIRDFKQKFAKVPLFFRNYRNKKFLRISAVFIALAVLVYLFKSWIVAAVVNGRPIYRLAVIRELESQGGKNILESLVERSLIFQEAGKEGIKVSQESIDNQLKNIEDSLKKQGVSLDEALAARGQTRAQLFDQIKLQKSVEAILGPKISVTEDEIKTYFKENSKLFDKNATFDSVKEQIKQQIFNQKLSTEYQKWINELKSKAKIFYLVKF